jgi:hypothetical protein
VAGRDIRRRRQVSGALRHQDELRKLGEPVPGESARDHTPSLYAAPAPVSGAPDGARDGAPEGVLESAGDGAREGVGEGARDGARDNAADSARDVDRHGVAGTARDGAADGARDGADRPDDGGPALPPGFTPGSVRIEGRSVPSLASGGETGAPQTGSAGPLSGGPLSGGPQTIGLPGSASSGGGPEGLEPGYPAAARLDSGEATVHGLGEDAHGEAGEGTLGEYPPALLRPGLASPRVLIDRVDVRVQGVDAVVEVRLTADNIPAVGKISGPARDGYVTRMAAFAAASAIDELLVDPETGSHGRCFIEHATVVSLGGCDVALVVLLLMCDGWVDQLSGSSVVSGDPREAMVRATLAAVNRRLEGLLS